MLLNRMTEDQLLRLRTKRKRPKSFSTEETPRQEAAKKIHATTDGQPCLPARMLMAALIAAGQYVRLDGKRQMSTAKSTIVPGFLKLTEHVYLLRPNKWELDIQQGRNPNGGEAVCLIRPRFDQWGFTFTLILDTSQVSEVLCRELVEVAVERMGFGDFRPGRKGTYGQTAVVGWKVL